MKNMCCAASAPGSLQPGSLTSHLQFHLPVVMLNTTKATHRGQKLTVHKTFKELSIQFPHSVDGKTKVQRDDGMGC